MVYNGTATVDQQLCFYQKFIQMNNMNIIQHNKQCHTPEMTVNHCFKKKKNNYFFATYLRRFLTDRLHGRFDSDLGCDSHLRAMPQTFPARGDAALLILGLFHLYVYMRNRLPKTFQQRGWWVTNGYTHIPRRRETINRAGLLSSDGLTNIQQQKIRTYCCHIRRLFTQQTLCDIYAFKRTKGNFRPDVHTLTCIRSGLMKT